jgi:hypothetical protein
LLTHNQPQTGTKIASKIRICSKKGRHAIPEPWLTLMPCCV